MIKKAYTDLAIKLLLNPNDENLDAYFATENIKWNILQDVARENRVFIRVYERLANMNVPLIDTYKKAVREERHRIELATRLMGKISRAYEKSDFKFIFIKNYQHYPDMGNDIDLFVQGYTNEADSVLIKRFKAKPCKRTLLNRVGGKTEYTVDGSPLEIEIHHGRMGPMGEHAVFPKFLIENRRTVNIDGVNLWVPSPEDQFIIQVIQRVYGRFFLRISELLYVINAICKGSLDWNYIIETTKIIGIYEGLCYYLNCVNIIYKNVAGKALPLCESELFKVSTTSKIYFKGFHYRLPLLRVGGKLYLQKFFSDIRALNWVDVSRLCLLPFFTTIVGFKALARRYDWKKYTMN